MKPSVYIAIPARDFLYPETVEGLLQAVKLLQKEGYEYHVDFHIGNPYVGQARSIMCACFLDMLYDELFFIDADVVFTGENFMRILSHDVDLVGGLYPFRFEVAPVPIANFKERMPKIDESGLTETVDLATGFMRIRRTVIESMVEKHPELETTKCTRSGRPISMIFDSGFQSPGTWTGEDYMFCRRWLDMGGKIYSDTTVQLGHIGRKIYRIKPDFFVC